MSSSSKTLTYDTSFMSPIYGASMEPLLHQYAEKMHEARTNIMSQRKSGAIGWLDVPSDTSAIKRIARVVASLKSCDTLLVLGIGGSDLGTRAILRALPSKRRVLFAGANTDPDELTEIFEKIDWKKTCVNIVSKSGDTIEPMSAFFLARERLRRAVGKSYASRIVATTDPVKGVLHDHAVKDGYHFLLIPPNVGGRYSVLPDVGLFPAAWAGIDIKSILAGAAEQTRLFEKSAIESQIAAQYAVLHAESYLRQGRSCFVLMPYAHRLELFGRWYRQLIAESLGKAHDKQGALVERGVTPIAALGATDQHSQIQLYMEGPQDKVITFMEIAQFDHVVKTPKIEKEFGRLAELSKRSLQDLIHAERRSTAEALASVDRPNGTLFIPKLDAYNLGQLFQMFMIATAYLGELFHVNAYDQPGVQEGKRRFWEIIDKS